MNCQVYGSSSATCQSARDEFKSRCPQLHLRHTDVEATYGESSDSQSPFLEELACHLADNLQRSVCQGKSSNLSALVSPTSKQIPPPSVLDLHNPDFKYCKSEVGDGGWDCARCDFAGGVLPCSKYSPYMNDKKHLAQNCGPQVGYWIPCLAMLCHKTTKDQIATTGICVPHSSLRYRQIMSKTTMWSPFPYSSPYPQGFISRSSVGHPCQGDAHTGFLTIKRVVMHQSFHNGKKAQLADVSKYGYCLHCPLVPVSAIKDHNFTDTSGAKAAGLLSADGTKRSVFHSVWEPFSTPDEIKAFDEHCIAKAFDSKGKLKSEYSCPKKFRKPCEGPKKYTCPNVPANEFAKHADFQKNRNFRPSLSPYDSFVKILVSS